MCKFSQTYRVLRFSFIKYLSPFSVLKMSLRDKCSINIFPEDIKKALYQSIHNLSATTCSDPILFKTLYKYDNENGKILVEHLSINDIFKTEKGDKYLIKEKRRTRYICENLHTKKIYLFPGIYEVFKE